MFQGLAIEVVRDDNQLEAAGGFLGGPLGMALAGGLRKRPRGEYARIFFNQPAAIDLAIRPREKRLAEDFAGTYEMESLVPHLADKFLCELLMEQLIRLWSSHHVEVCDEYVEVGPLSGTAVANARLVADLTEAASQCGVISVVSEVDNDDSLDSFCFYCGNPVASTIATCPHCNGDLSED